MTNTVDHLEVIHLGVLSITLNMKKDHSLVSIMRHQILGNILKN